MASELNVPINIFPGKDFFSKRFFNSLRSAYLLIFKLMFLIGIIVLFSALGVNIFKSIWKFIIGIFSSFFGLFYKKSKPPDTSKT